MMVHHHQHHHRSYFQQLRKGEAQQQQQPDFMEAHQFPSFIYHDYFNHRKSKLAAVRVLFLFSLLSCTCFFGPRLLFYSLGTEYEPELQARREEQNRGPAPCSSMANNSICCDRTAFRTDVCYMRGDVRTHSPSNSILLFGNSSTTTPSIEEKIRPYTRKWETSIMDTIDELRLRTAGADDSDQRCDVRHDVPAVVFSTGGYTGNVYHEFNDGIIPLYITSQRFNRQVVFIMLEYHDWWMTKYSDVVSRLSDHPPIDYSNDRRTHCFSEVIVGLRIHDELTVNSDGMDNNKTIFDFRQLLDEAYTPRVRTIVRAEEQAKAPLLKPVETERNVSVKEKPKLVVVSRNGSRAMENEKELVKLAEGVGFEVKVLRPQRTSELAKIYQALNSCDAMVGVHGAAMTHFLFMRPGSVFIQIVPLGTDWAAETYYGEPAKKMGLRYHRYKILPRESSLYREYGKGDPVLRDPEGVNSKGWQVTKKVYLDGQNVILDLARFRKRLFRAHQYIVSRKTSIKLNWKRKSIT